MNDKRRKAIRAVARKLNDLALDCEDWDAFNEAGGEGLISDIATEVGDIRDEEQEYFDNMTENFQNAEKGQKAQEDIDELTRINDELEALAVAESDYDGDALHDTLAELADDLEAVC